jgi:hypothetical protein
LSRGDVQARIAKRADGNHLAGPFLQSSEKLITNCDHGLTGAGDFDGNIVDPDTERVF